MDRKKASMNRLFPELSSVVAFSMGIVLMLGSGMSQAERIKDLATVAGVRSNQLIGYGLVIGLDGSGDQTSQVPFTTQSLRNMLAQLGGGATQCQSPA